MTQLAQVLDLSAGDALFVLAAMFLAGVVRGFSGFALSALVMASCASILSPVELIPVLLFVEIAASIATLRGGVRDADRRVVTGLVLGNVVGWPIGLALTTSVSVETSKLIALVVILVLAASQLAKVRMAFLATRPGLYASGVVSGVVGGVAAVGGMVVALYVLSQQAAPRVMRASLIMYLLVSAFISFFIMASFGVMTVTAVIRGLLLSPVAVAGVGVGTLLFTERYQRYYRPVCLALLIGLALSGVGRLVA